MYIYTYIRIYVHKSGDTDSVSALSYAQRYCVAILHEPASCIRSRLLDKEWITESIKF